jgi:hypothetical protein
LPAHRAQGSGERILRPITRSGHPIQFRLRSARSAERSADREWAHLAEGAAMKRAGNLATARPRQSDANDRPWSRQLDSSLRRAGRVYAKSISQTKDDKILIELHTVKLHHRQRSTSVFPGSAGYRL